MRKKPNTWYQSFGKRSFDVVLAACLSILCSPLALVLMLCVYISVGRPIFFKQKRPGRHFKPFEIYKFRTMHEDKDGSGVLLSDELRLSKFGLFLRKYSLDELPQLYNILRGELSFVGPRPLLMKYVRLYTDEQAKRHDVKPGITGWAQINGRNSIGWEEKFARDLIYTQKISFLFDMKILLKTFFKVTRGQDVMNSELIVMPEFTGTKEMPADTHEL